LQEVDSSICNVKEMKEYVDEFIYKEVTKWTSMLLFN
jgi:hypothetical protein